LLIFGNLGSACMLAVVTKRLKLRHFEQWSQTNDMSSVEGRIEETGIVINVLVRGERTYALQKYIRNLKQIRQSIRQYHHEYVI